jgi:hypothetical protein
MTCEKVLEFFRSLEEKSWLVFCRAASLTTQFGNKFGVGHPGAFNRFIGLAEFSTLLWTFLYLFDPFSFPAVPAFFSLHFPLFSFLCISLLNLTLHSFFFPFVYFFCKTTC